MFTKKLEELFKELDRGKTMVLSTALDDKVSSRMMSIVVMNERFYFQTDKTFRKYKQIKGNPYVSLCTDNIQIEGICEELGRPTENVEFCEIYKELFPMSYSMYSNLNNEVLFQVTPTIIHKWIYENGTPYVEAFDFTGRDYIKNKYERR